MIPPISHDAVDCLNPSPFAPVKIELVNLAGKPRESQRRGGQHGKDGGGLPRQDRHRSHHFQFPASGRHDRDLILKFTKL
jgi:hypothetical protein